MEFSASGNFRSGARYGRSVPHFRDERGRSESRDHSETTPYGISGIYVLVLPASKVTAGKPLDLAVKVPPGGGDWFMVHECRSIDEVTRLAICPRPEMSAIAAFTPHKEGRFGVTIAEYEIDLGR